MTIVCLTLLSWYQVVLFSVQLKPYSFWYTGQGQGPCYLVSRDPGTLVLEFSEYLKFYVFNKIFMYFIEIKCHVDEKIIEASKLCLCNMNMTEN